MSFRHIFGYKFSRLKSTILELVCFSSFQLFRFDFYVTLVSDLFIVVRAMDSGRKFKGRGKRVSDLSGEGSGDGQSFDRLGSGSGTAPQKSVEGWIVFVTNVHEEAQEDDIHDKFADFGEIKNLQLPVDRRTGYVKGYCMVEYDEKSNAQKAIEEMDGGEFMGKTVAASWAFASGPLREGKDRRRRN